MVVSLEESILLSVKFSTLFPVINSTMSNHGTVSFAVNSLLWHVAYLSQVLWGGENSMCFDFSSNLFVSSCKCLLRRTISRKNFLNFVFLSMFLFCFMFYFVLNSLNSILRQSESNPYYYFTVFIIFILLYYYKLNII